MTKIEKVKYFLMGIYHLIFEGYFLTVFPRIVGSRWIRRKPTLSDVWSDICAILMRNGELHYRKQIAKKVYDDEADEDIVDNKSMVNVTPIDPTYVVFTHKDFR